MPSNINIHSWEYVGGYLQTILLKGERSILNVRGTAPVLGPRGNKEGKVRLVSTGIFSLHQALLSWWTVISTTVSPVKPLSFNSFNVMYFTTTMNKKILTKA